MNSQTHSMKNEAEDLEEKSSAGFLIYLASQKENVFLLL